MSLNNFTLVLPIRLDSIANRRGNWKKHFFGTQLPQQKEVQAEFRRWSNRQLTYLLVPPFTVTLTRIGGRKLDSDNLAASFKHIQDQVARELKINDGDDRVTWEYRQEPGGREYEIRIEIVSMNGR